MLSRGDYLMISEKKRQGMFIKNVATELGVHPKTVSRALKRGGEPQPFLALWTFGLGKGY